jgi:dihydrofolate reductase
LRKLIAAFKTSVDGKIEGPQGFADWVDAWSEDYGLTPEIDACLLGGKMYPGYEQYWTAIQTAPDKPLPMTGKLPTPAEVEWGRFAAETPHYVLSTTSTTALWPTTRVLRSIDDIAALKQQSGKDIYLMGGARITASLMGAGLLDELRLIVHPLLAGEGKSLFATNAGRHRLEMRAIDKLGNGRFSTVYAVCAGAPHRSAA